MATNKTIFEQAAEEGGERTILEQAIVCDKDGNIVPHYVGEYPNQVVNPEAAHVVARAGQSVKASFAKKCAAALEKSEEKSEETEAAAE